MIDEVKATPEASLPDWQELNDNIPGLQPGVKVHLYKPVQLQIILPGKHFLNRNARTFRKVGIPRPAIGRTPPLTKGDGLLNRSKIIIFI